MTQTTQTQPASFHIPGIFIVILLFFTTLPHISADLYVPSLPFITHAFNTNSSTIQMTLSIFLFGFSLSQLFYGPISDRIGRRKPMLFGIGLCFLGSLLCLFAQTIPILLCGRLLQGIGCGACSSLGRSFLRDLISGSHLAKLSSIMGMMTATVTAMAPTFGGYLQHFWGWRASFLFLTLLAFVIWFVVFKNFPETNKNLNPHATKISVAFKNYFILLCDKPFIGYAILCACSYGGLLGFITFSPFLLQTVVGLSAVQYGWLAFITSGSIFLAAFTNGRFILKFGIANMALFGILAMLSGGVVMFIFAYLGYLNTTVIMMPVALFAFGCGLTFSNAFAGAIHDFPHMAGTAGALYGCLQILGGSLSSSIMATVPPTTQMPLAALFMSLSVLSLLAWKFLATTQRGDMLQ